MSRTGQGSLRFCFKPCSLSRERQAYQEAIHALNRLQTNASVIRESVKGEKLLRQCDNVQLTNKYLERCGIDIDEFERRIGVVHVSGTKGKGTTCALCESCLRAHGYKTGLFTSPHLVNVAERIRVNGSPLTTDQFVRHFWHVYNLLQNNKDDERDMPSYFKFLTVMAFSVFLKEEVDVAIVEVGIGGELDCTNVLRNTPVVGITSLDFDHTKILGDDIESIAWQKGGIIKPGSSAFTVQGHDLGALEVLQRRAEEKKSTLTVVPSLDRYQMDTTSMTPVVKLNASLAIQLTQAFISWKKGVKYDIPHIGKLDRQTYNGIVSCFWPGRCQKVTLGNLNIYMDGAHTANSASVSAEWFDSTAPRDKRRALLFNCTGGREPSSLLQHLVKCRFNHAVFSTNNTTSDGTNCDLLLVGSRTCEMLSKCEANKQVWQQLVQAEGDEKNCECSIADSVTQAFEILQKSDESENAECHILVTGSLHLVGSALAVLHNFTNGRTTAV